MPKALWSQASTALPIVLDWFGFGTFSLVGLIQYIGPRRFGLIVLVWYVWFVGLGL